ncbi:ATP-binding protein [Halanaerobacter jeridensis]|uniref:histidine kinase n=1 Tax=Halanaerobacter jeridensis TaxID=706427 RepID=A0A938XN78_9FIRM|nr:ATP-binding protein [Halanaerobacter jeridensis]MBM7555448.1 two-component system sensor histidine kinase ResE [Halanaerobacter jeridensis]
MFKSLFSKIMSSYILIPTLILIALFVFLPYNLESYLAQQKKEELVKNGKEISEIIASEDRIDINKILSSFAQSLDTNLVLINESGQIVNRSRGVMRMMNQIPTGPMMRNSNGHRGMMMPNSSHMHQSMQNESMPNNQFQNLMGLKEELKKVLNGEIISFKGENKHLEQAIIAVGIPINDGSSRALFLISPMHDFENAIDNIRMLTLQVVIGAIIFALLLGYIISKSITEPIAEMKKKVNKITDGDFSTKLEDLPDDELGELGQSFNYMSAKLEENLSELSTEKNRMHEMLTSMTEGVLGVTATGEIMLSNTMVKEILSLKQSLQGRYFSDCLPQDLSEIISQVLNNNEEQEIEFELNDQILTAQAAPVKKSDKELWGVIILVSDITEIKRLDEMRRLFVANVSHELKTPLTSIQGYLEAILDGMVEDEEKEQEYLQRVLNETDRMSNLVGDVLDLAKLQSKQFEFELRPVNLKTLISSVYNNLENSLGDKELILDIPEEVYVKADRDKLKEVIINLLSNAIKFTSAEGTIEIDVQMNKKQDKVIVNVIDDGVGIPKNELAHIWERFHQVDRSRNPDQQGTGLGLAIVKEIITGMNGQINVESTVGVGSKFSFSLEISNKGVSSNDEKIT